MFHTAQIWVENACAKQRSNLQLQFSLYQAVELLKFLSATDFKASISFFIGNTSRFESDRVFKGKSNLS